MFIPHLPEERPVLLILDGHESHIKYDVRELAVKHKIEIAKLPAHTTHILQPLDVAIMKPMKGLYDQAAHSLFLKERRYIQKIDFPSLIGEVWRGFKPEYAINGFRKTGIIPLNRNAIEDSSLLPSEPFTSQLSSPSQNPTQPTETQTPLPSEPFTSQLSSPSQNPTQPTETQTPLPSEPFTSQLSSPSQNPTQPTETQTPSQTQFTTQQLQVETHLQNTPQLQPSGTQAQSQQSYQPIQPTPLNDSDDDDPFCESLVDQLTHTIDTEEQLNSSQSSSASNSSSGLELKDFFLSQQSKGATSSRGRRVASLGESLTAEEALEKQRKQEEEKRNKELEKEKRKLERLKKKEEKIKKSTKGKGRKRQEKEECTSTRPKRRKQCDNLDVCGICGNAWENETEESEVWVECNSCNQWYHAICTGMEDEEINSIDDYICDVCN